METIAKHKTAVKLLAPGDGESFSVLDIQITPKVVAGDTGGAYTLLEQSVPPHAGTPPHILYQEDKTIYVIAGAFAILVDDKTRIVRAGACVVIPRGTVHNFRNLGPDTGKILVIVSPAGHERFLREISKLDGDMPADRKKMGLLAEANKVEILTSA